jgi:hypothetical protein
MKWRVPTPLVECPSPTTIAALESNNTLLTKRYFFVMENSYNRCFDRLLSRLTAYYRPRAAISHRQRPAKSGSLSYEK